MLCRQCFQAKARGAAAKMAEATPVSMATQTSIAPGSETVAALQGASTDSNGSMLSPDAAVVAAAQMAAASPHSSVASAADLASITPGNASQVESIESTIPAELVAAAASGESLSHAQELHAMSAEAPKA